MRHGGAESSAQSLGNRDHVAVAVRDCEVRSHPAIERVGTSGLDRPRRDHPAELLARHDCGLLRSIRSSLLLGIAVGQQGL